jgi:hypothetical protein
VHGPEGFSSQVFSHKNSLEIISQYAYKNPFRAMHKMGTLFLPTLDGFLSANVKEWELGREVLP